MHFLEKTVQKKCAHEILMRDHMFHYRVVKQNKLTSNIIELILIPLSRLMRYESGQYCKLMFGQNNCRSYSIVNPPEKNGKIVLHIRISKNSGFMLEKIAMGNTLSVTGPFGNCAYNFFTHVPVLFLAEGIGLAAFYAILDHAHFSTEQGMLIWLRKSCDVEYGRASLEKWNKKIKIFELILCNEADNKLLKKCFEFITQYKKIRLYFAGSPLLSHFLSENLTTRDEKFSIDFFSDI